jgi:phage baseplate assembly protein W
MSDPASPEIIGRGVAFPFGVGRGAGIAMASGIADIEQAMWIILSTAPGDRPMRPEFGCGAHRFVFDDIDATTVTLIDRAVRHALHRWEPRIEVHDVAFDEPKSVGGALVMDITYTVRRTSTRHNLVYPFYMVPAEGPR